MLFCGLDVGTSGVKAMVFDEKGTLVAGEYKEYILLYEPDGRRVLSADDVWSKTKAVLQSVAQKTQGKIDALAAASFGESFVLLDENDNMLTEIMVFTDRRGEREYFDALEKTSAQEIAEICGLKLSPTYSISKLLYLQKNYPDIYAKAKRILFIEDLVNYMLSGEAAVDYSVACRTMFFDVRECVWSSNLMNKFGIDRSKLSTPVKMGTPIGKIRPEIAKELGLNPNMQIVTGGHDQPVCGVGAGLRKGSVVCSMGTSECMTPYFDGMLPAKTTIENGLPSEPVWDKGKYCTMAYNPSSGVMIQWFFKTYAQAEWKNDKPPYALFEENYPEKPTKIMVQPYLVGSGPPYMDHQGRLAYTGIDIGTTRYDLYRATLEGLVLDQYLNMSLMKEHGISPEHIVCTGGGSKSLPWLKTKADITQTTVSTLECSEAGALGCAIICAYATGIYSSMEEAAKQMSRIKETIEPNPVYKDFYQEKFQVYRNLHDHLKEESAFACK